jgi:threonine synthase
MTALLPTKRLGAFLGLSNLLVKDEGLNPTGSFKARGMTAAVTRAKQLGAKALATPTAGNAGGALAAYAAAAGIPAVIVMPADTPSANVMECQAFGAKVVKLNGLISDCGKYVAERKDREGWYDVSTLKEPYRVEGKKTMGYELWEQLGGKLPDVILYPTGGGVGLIGMCKAFDEMQEMGWIGTERPRMVVVQAEGCAPIVKAWEAHRESSEFFQNAATLASGLRVPDHLRFSNPSNAAADARNRAYRDRRRNVASREGAGVARRNIRRTGGRRDRERHAQTRGFRVDQAARIGRALQHRNGL